MPAPESSPEREPHLTHTREILHLAEQASQGGLKVLPGDKWALSYPNDGAQRNEKLNGLLQGAHDPKDVAKDLKPNALIYDVADIERIGLEGMTARIRELTAMATHGDYERFASFVSGMKGKETDVGTLQTLYDGITKSRTRGKLLDAYGKTGKNQLETALRHDAEGTAANFGMVRGIDRVLQALKMQWIERRGVSSAAQTNAVLDSLNARERELYDKLADAYASYADKGDEASFQTLERLIQEQMPAISDVQKQMSPETEKLRDELEDYMENAVPPGAPGDLSIPPDDEDEYHTQEPTPGESSEKGPAQAMFEITPAGTSTQPLSGYYSSGRKSYFDTATKTWSKKKQLTSYADTVGGDRRWRISGKVGGELKSLPIPAGHCLDASSLQWTGEKPEIFRDQKGCFYVKPSGPCSFSVEFLKETVPFSESPIAEDLQPLTQRSFSADAETMLSGLSGSASDKATRIVRHVHGHHFYPGGGDLKMAQALQHKLRTESTGDEYLGKLEQSEYLECYSSNTLFVGYCRSAGIPARLVVGHKIDGAHDGKAAITGSTGHAWSEFWDGSAWRRIDATPPAKPEDKKDEKQEGEQNSTPSQEADDDGIDERPQENDLAEQMRDKTQQQLQDVQNQQMDQAGEQDVSSGESSLQQAKEAMERIQQKQRDMQQKIQDAESFEDLEDLKKETENSELFDDMKENMDEMREAKEKQKKEELKDRIEAMEEDGFVDEDTAEEMREQMEDASAKDLDGLQQVIEREQKDHLEYESLRDEVMPLVDEWYKYFVENLPKESEIDIDDTTLARRGVMNRRAMMRPSALLFGKVRNPRVFKPAIKPRFIASILVDVSGSMKERGKLQNARKLLVFYSELFSRISREFGYICFSINTFSDSITKIKGFDQDYDSTKRYDYEPGQSATVKARLMRSVKSQGGTNMLDALKTTSAELDEQKDGYDDHVSALYFLGDGEDTCGNKENIRRFLAGEKEEEMFGDHLKSAVLLGTEQNRRILSDLFGENQTSVADNFEELVEKSMISFANDIEDYCKNKAA